MASRALRPCPEPNAEKLQLPEPYRGLRFDFVVHRVDGTCVRLHPSQGAEAQPVIGHLEPWCKPVRYPSKHPLDVISSEIAQRMLMDRISAAAKQGGIMLQQSVIENEWFGSGSSRRERSDVRS